MTRVTRPGPVVIELDNGSTFEADEVLAAFGRRHGTSGIGLETIGIEPDGPLVVDDDLRVPGHDWLFAIGDVNGRVLLTHMGKYQGRLAADTILGRTVELRSDGGDRLASSSPIPRSGPSASRSREPRRRASTSATSTSRRAATPAARSSATGRSAPRGSSSTRTAG